MGFSPSIERDVTMDFESARTTRYCSRPCATSSKKRSSRSPCKSTNSTDSRRAGQKNGRDGLPGELFSRAVRRGRTGRALLRDCGGRGLEGLRQQRRADLGAQLAGQQPDFRLRHRTTETEMAAAAQSRRDHWLPPVDRAERRQRRRRQLPPPTSGKATSSSSTAARSSSPTAGTWEPELFSPPSTARSSTRGSAHLSSI